MARLGHTVPLIETFFQQIPNAFQVLSSKENKQIFKLKSLIIFWAGVCLEECPIKSSLMVSSWIYLIWQCQSNWPPSKEASPLKSGRMLYQHVPMFERGLAVSLLTLGHTKKVYSFPLIKQIYPFYFGMGNTPDTHSTDSRNIFRQSMD